MAKTLDTVTLTAPSSDPNIGVGQTFTLSCTYTQAGHGGEEVVDLNWEFHTASGGPYTAIPTTDQSSLSVVTNPTTGSDSAQTHSVTVTGDGAGTWYVHVRAVGQTSTLVREHGDQVVTVTDTTDELLADDVQSTSEVSVPAIGQTHALTNTGVQSTSEVTIPAIGQTHALAATSVQSTSEVTNPALSEVVALLANDVQSTSEVSVPALAHIHVLAATSIESASQVSSPALSEVGGGGGGRPGNRTGQGWRSRMMGMRRRYR